ncbi:hypothetical protein L6452_40366 [Arctium lappa]|uniref:Uncharacterized protein n=1 Tax=Arctium lappa TaxID=4217 RepID=A0ACB8XLQ8_ARCLA|nr:hypothetical protein L6452_40366 [Arctium lappa]
MSFNAWAKWSGLEKRHTQNLQSGCEEKGALPFNLIVAKIECLQKRHTQNLQSGCEEKGALPFNLDKYGNPSNILRNEYVDPLPPIFTQMIKRMVRWHVLPPTCVPNNCIVNIYDEEDCIPPHIDHHDLLRPFCTISFLTECNILFGSNLKIVGPGEFAGPVFIPLPTGSMLILKGNGADVAKHCIIPMVLTPSRKPPLQQNQIVTKEPSSPATVAAPPRAVVVAPPRVALKLSGGSSFVIGENDFPPLGVGNTSQQRGHKKNGFRS